MKILSPIDRADEVGPLSDAGADEFYGGYVPDAWRKKYSMLGSANHRYFPSAQIKDERELKTIIKSAHALGKKFFLTLNAPYYLEGQYDDLVRDALRFSGVGVDAFIVSDLGLIVRLRDRVPDMPLHLSTLGTVTNSLSARFFHGLGILRVVFPRELTLQEIKGIVRKNPGVEFDSFVMVGKCPNIEGFCSFTHSNQNLIWPCEEPYKMAAIKSGAGTGRIIRAQKGWSKVNRRRACGLCAVPDLRKAGVGALKVVGRGGPTGLKVKVVSAVRDVLELSRLGMEGEPLRRRAKKIYSETFGDSCNPYVCYFPELWK